LTLIQEENMKKIIFTLILFAFLQSVTLAQSSDKRAWGYVFGGVGGQSESNAASLHVGGGGEGLLYKGFGIGGEIGYFAPFERAGDGFGLGSVNVGYHFNPSQKVVPFVTGGYSVAFRTRSSSGGNFGGGVNYWMKDKVGLRFEFRDHIFSSDSPHTYSFRVGLNFR
jgi:hypothetical protein